jgi:AraC-like DNA-binding protein
LNPVLAVVAQGTKQLVLGDKVFRYDPEHYILLSLALPVSASVIKATHLAPYLGLCLELDWKELTSLDLSAGKERGKSALSLAVTRLEPDLLDPLCRLVRLLSHPKDIDVLAPLIIREIHYRLSQGSQGDSLREIVRANGIGRKVGGAIAWLQRNFDKPFSTAALLKATHMSASSLHQHFKKLTNMSPLQYQKHLRLNKARRLMLVDALDASHAAYQVGYVSPSQFSREYTRKFGLPPSQDIEGRRQLSEAH